MGLLKAERLIANRRRSLIGPMAHRMLRMMSGIEVPDDVEIGSDLVVHHHGFGLVVHQFTRIGDRVHLFQGVTIGRSDVWVSRAESDFEGIDIEDDVWICAGAKVVGGAGRLRVGRGTIVGANAVLLDSTGEWEIWAGSPARLVGHRDRPAGSVR
jgi:serine O-acetyltransferase